MLIAFEGIDGSGKSLMARKVHAALSKRGVDCVLTAEPTDGALGNRIKSEIASGTPALNNMTLQILFTADRSDHVEKVIMPALERGAVVLTDRYFWSTVAYGHALGLDTKWLIGMNSVFPVPDLTLWFRLSPKTAYKRRKQRMLKLDRLEYNPIQERVSEGYVMLASKYGKKGWCEIDAGRPVDSVFRDVMRSIDRILEK